MRIVYLFFYVAMFFVANLQAQVIIEKVHLEPEFYGPFNKTRMEIYFFNPTDRDSLSGFLDFTINQSAMVTELWLEIDGKLKPSETFSKKTGERTFYTIVYRKDDSALLTKQANGSFHLGGFKAIFGDFFHPTNNFEQSKRSLSISKYLINEKGEGIFHELLRSLHPALDFIAIDVVSQVKWKPARARERRVKSIFAIPFHFNVEYHSDNEDSNQIKAFTFANKKFEIHIEDEQYLFLEEGFQMDMAIKTRYLSDDFFALLFQYPELIQYCYYLIRDIKVIKNLGVMIPETGQSVLVE